MKQKVKAGVKIIKPWLKRKQCSTPSWSYRFGWLPSWLRYVKSCQDEPNSAICPDPLRTRHSNWTGMCYKPSVILSLCPPGTGLSECCDRCLPIPEWGERSACSRFLWKKISVLWPRLFGFCGFATPWASMAIEWCLELKRIELLGKNLRGLVLCRSPLLSITYSHCYPSGGRISAKTSGPLSMS